MDGAAVKPHCMPLIIEISEHLQAAKYKSPRGSTHNHMGLQPLQSVLYDISCWHVWRLRQDPSACIASYLALPG